MLGQHRATAGQVGPVEVGVDHDDVGLGGTGPGVLGEAVPPGRATEGPRALPRRSRDHGPRPEVGLEGELGPVAGGRVPGPAHQAAHLVGDSRRVRGIGLGRRGQGVVGVGRVGRTGGQGQLATDATDLADPLATDVVAPTLQHGEGQPVVGGCGHQREILAGQLILEGFGGRGHHHPFAGQGGGHQVGEGLAGAGAGLHDQVAPAGHRRCHRGGHLDLSGTGFAAPGEAGGHTVQG